MFRTCLIVGFVLLSANAYAETQSPWFGGEANMPEQVAAIDAGNKSQDVSQTEGCAIYSCPSLVNIAMPLKNGATNP